VLRRTVTGGDSEKSEVTNAINSRRPVGSGGYG